MTAKERQKKEIQALHDKYYGKKKSKKVPKQVVAETERFRKEVFGDGKALDKALHAMPKKESEPKEILTHTLKSLKDVPAETQALPKEGTRMAMMLEARNRGIRNFRILNKEELAFVLCDNQSHDNIAACVTAAVARWKSGWGKRGKRQTEGVA